MHPRILCEQKSTCAMILVPIVTKVCTNPRQSKECEIFDEDTMQTMAAICWYIKT